MKALQVLALAGATALLLTNCGGSSGNEATAASFCKASVAFNDSLTTVSDMMGEDPSVDEFKNEFKELVDNARDLAAEAPSELQDDTKLIKEAIGAFAAVMEKFDYDVYAIATSSVAMKDLEIVGSEEFTKASDALTSYTGKSCS